jgi:hypothetical protein
MMNNSDVETLAVPVLKAGAVIGIGRTKTLELVKSGDLQSILIGRKRLILMASIRRYVEHRQAAQK